MQISLLTYSRGSVYLLPPSAVGEMRSEKKQKKKRRDCVCAERLRARTHAVLAVLEVWLPYLCWLHISSCCLWRKNSWRPEHPLPRPLHPLAACFIIGEATLRWPRRTPVWADRKYLSVLAGVSYSRPILVLNQLREDKNKSEMEQE